MAEGRGVAASVSGYTPPRTLRHFRGVVARNVLPSEVRTIGRCRPASATRAGKPTSLDGGSAPGEGGCVVEPYGGWGE